MDTHIAPQASMPAKRRGRPRKQSNPIAISEAPPSCIQHLDQRTRKAIERATRLLEGSAVYRTEAMNSPSAVRDYLRLKLAPLEHEEFHVIWLDAQNRIIAFDRLFRGALTQTSVYPREVVKAGLAHNAAAVILAHNHPSGVITPSHADMALTSELKAALRLVDIKVLDHFIVAGADTPLSFAERGIL